MVAVEVEVEVVVVVVVVTVAVQSFLGSRKRQCFCLLQGPAVVFPLRSLALCGGVGIVE